MRIANLVLSVALLPLSALAQEVTTGDAVPGLPFQESDIIALKNIDKLKDYLPPEFWENREYFFYEGMSMEIGPAQRKYTSGADAYIDATEKFRGQPTVGKDGALETYTAGQPFPNDAIDCKADPNAGVKIIWNFVKAWEGSGAKSNWSYTYWDRGDQLPLYYEGQARSISLSQRPEPQYLKQAGDIFKNERRLNAFGIEVDAPFDARGILVLTYRYKAADAPLDQAKNDDTWVYVPDLRRTRRISTAQRTDSVQGTDFTMDDLRSFAGIPPQYEWECLGEATVITPTNTKHLAHPYTEDYNFGPYGFSFANDRWEVRDAWIIRFDPRNEDHPYHHKDIYIDKETYNSLYSFAYDRKEDLWKIIWHNHRYSEDWKGQDQAATDPRAKNGVWYETWEGIDQVNDLRIISDIIVNVQTGSGNRIEFWDNHGTPLPSRAKIRRYIDLGRLSGGR